MKVLYLPDDQGEKLGVDDFLARGHTAVELEPFLRAGLPDPGLFTIRVDGRHLDAITDDCWGVMEQANGDEPVLFDFAGQIARIDSTDGLVRIAVLTQDDLAYFLERQCRFVRREGTDLRPARLPRDVNADLRTAWDKPLPSIRGISRSPIVTADGAIVTAPGYQLDTGLFYAPVGEPVPDVPDSPPDADASAARALLQDEWLVDFPFADEASFAHAVALALTPVVREMIDGPTPLFTIDATSPGTGKSLLAQTAALIVVGSDPAMMTQPRAGEEFRKRITALLLQGALFVLMDNLKDRIDSAELAAVLTASIWEDRILGVSEMARVPNRALWVAIGNHVDLDVELARRAALIRIDPGVERPWERSGFKHYPLARWVRAERHRLVWALLVLVRRWVIAGRPRWRGPPMGSFESWAETIGGILQVAGIPGFLTNRESLFDRADRATGEWRRFVAAWRQKYGETVVGVQDLLPLIVDGHLPHLFATAAATVRSTSTRLGKALQAQRDRVVGSHVIRYVGTDTKTKAKHYRLEPAPAEPFRTGSADVPSWGASTIVGDSERSERSERSEPPRRTGMTARRTETGTPAQSQDDDERLVSSERFERSESATPTGSTGAAVGAEPLSEVPRAEPRCSGGCGTPVPTPGRRCTDCATQSVREWKARPRAKGRSR